MKKRIIHTLRLLGQDSSLQWGLSDIEPEINIEKKVNLKKFKVNSSENLLPSINFISKENYYHNILDTSLKKV